MLMQRRDLLAAAAGGVAAIAGCSDDDGGNADASIRGETLTLTTTTSTYDTGLLDEVNAAFEDRYGVAVDAVAQGTGAALETGRAGDADVVMVHARSLEDEFMRDGYGVNRRDVMFNDFVVVGPEDDPAGIDGTEEVTDAFRAIAETGSVFVSRGDSSGTHAKERAIWDAAGIEPGGEWYRETGSGMGEVLNQANQTPGYTLADRGTYLSQRSELDVSIRVEGPIEGGPALLANPYGIVAVNPGVHETVNYDLAMSYIGFLTSQRGQTVIEEYTVEGEQLFFPETDSEDPNFEQYVPEGWTPDER
ncbi:solute-binding protein [Halorubrum sp. JWXQ-INN 858]|nr:substrate-binding domain-containing protein [Halorubrum sp. JWXQ-INN 858]MWV64925.1 solute-binding protein [Halorubrum sp. JWXQ-INN 858]